MSEFRIKFCLFYLLYYKHLKNCNIEKNRIEIYLYEIYIKIHTSKYIHDI